MFVSLIAIAFAGVADRDRDGVEDAFDICPNTDTWMVDEQGCSCDQKTCPQGLNCTIHTFKAICTNNATNINMTQPPELPDKNIGPCFDEASPGSGESAELLSLDEAVVYETAIQALTAYASLNNVNITSLNTSDAFIEAVVGYVNSNMGDNITSIKMPADDIIKYSKIDYGCAERFCGSSVDRAILTAALLRALSVSSRCVYIAESTNHTFNIIDYLEAYRIVDKGNLGDYFYTATYNQNYAVKNIWNDYLGKTSTNNIHPSQYTYNYPDGPLCPTGGWTDQTYYIDGCPFLGMQYVGPMYILYGNNAPN